MRKDADTVPLMWTPESLPAYGPRYLALVERIQRDIADGRLRAGMQLPPQRELAGRLGLDLTTVSRAYVEAGRRGLVTGQVGRGTFVRAQADASALSVGRSGTDGVVDLSLNLPPAAGVEEAERALALALRALPEASSFQGLLEYQANAGRADHREAGASWVARRGMQVSPDAVIVCSGAQHALTVLLTTYAPPGSVVMAEALTYPVFKVLAEQLRLQVLGIAMDDEGLIPEAFRDACRTGASRVLYCTPTLQNPTAALMSAPRRQEIASIARQFDVTILEDDVYGMLPREAPAALTAFAPERSFFISSLSKAIAPGLRIAYVTAPTERAAKQLAAAVRATSWMATPLTAEIAALWVRDGTAARLLSANQSEANVRQRLALTHLGDFDWTAHPESYHGWLTLPQGWSTAEFTMQARRHGIVVTPSDAFSVVAAVQPPAVRLGIAAARTREGLERALTRIAQIVETGPEVGLSLI